MNFEQTEDNLLDVVECMSPYRLRTFSTLIKVIERNKFDVVRINKNTMSTGFYDLLKLLIEVGFDHTKTTVTVGPITEMSRVRVLLELKK